MPLPRSHDTRLSGLGSPPRVAVVDDDPGVRRGLDRLLRSAGYTVATFCSGEAFLRGFRLHPIQCLILDIALGDMSGFDLEDRLNAAGAEFPILLITAHDKADLGPRLLRSRAAGFLQKPLDDDLLLAAIKRALGGTDP